MISGVRTFLASASCGASGKTSLSIYLRAGDVASHPHDCGVSEILVTSTCMELPFLLMITNFTSPRPSVRLLYTQHNISPKLTIEAILSIKHHHESYSSK